VVFHGILIVCADTPGFSVTVVWATVTLAPLPLFTSIVMVMLTGMVPVLLTVTVMSTVLPAVTETVDRVAEPSWTDGNGEITINVMLTRW